MDVKFAEISDLDEKKFASLGPFFPVMVLAPIFCYRVKNEFPTLYFSYNILFCIIFF